MEHRNVTAAPGRRPRGEGTRSRDILTPLHSRGRRPALFLVHPSGGSSVPYLALARHLGDDQPSYGVDAVGLDGGAPLTSVPAMAERYREAIRTVQPHGPYHLAGWSVGGGFAHAVATRMRALGEPVALLALIDAPPPPEMESAPDKAEALARFAENVALTVGAPQPLVGAAELRALPPASRMPLVLRRLADAGVSPPEAADFIRARAAVFEALLAAWALWRPDRYDGRIDVFQAALAGVGDGVRGWSAWTSGDVVRHRVPGDHYSMMRSPQVESLADALRAQIDRDL